MLRRSVTLLAALAILSAACSGTDDADSITVYSGRSEELVAPLIEQFEEEAGIDVEVRYGDSAELAATILEEGANSPADVFFAQDPASLGAVALSGLFRQLDDALASIDQPTFDGINTYFVSRAVREAGITVALSGLGGDELFGGYQSFLDLPRAARWSRRTRVLPESWLKTLGYAAARLRLGAFGAVPPQTRWGKLADLLGARPDLLDLYQVSSGLFTERFKDGLLAQRAAPAELDAGLPVVGPAAPGSACRRGRWTRPSSR